jgi:hypothetical protein
LTLTRYAQYEGTVNSEETRHAYRMPDWLEMFVRQGACLALLLVAVACASGSSSPSPSASGAALIWPEGAPLHAVLGTIDLE